MCLLVVSLSRWKGVSGLVEPVTLGVIAAALVAKALDRAEDDAVDAGEGALRRLIALVRDRFSGEKEAAGTALARVEDAPDSPKRVRELAGVIDALADRDGGFRSELEGLIEEAQRSGVDVGRIVQTATGIQIAQVADVVDSTITISYGAAPADRPGGERA